MSDARSVAGSRVPLHAETSLGSVSLNVADLDRQVAFYREVLGFEVQRRAGRRAWLGAGEEDLLELVEVSGARRPPRSTGLYHFAVLLPSRRELARPIARLNELGHPHHPTDHVMTQATYLTDPEGQEVELYADTPEEGDWSFANGVFSARRADGTPSNGLEPLDVESLFRELSAGDRLDQPIPEETRIGHVHLYVRDLDEALRFYSGVIGFEEMGRAPRFKMGFVSAGGYHHHIGLNTWMGEGAPPPPPGSLGLRHFTVLVPDAGELARVKARLTGAGVSTERSETGILARDPSENAMLFTARGE